MHVSSIAALVAVLVAAAAPAAVAQRGRRIIFPVTAGGKCNHGFDEFGEPMRHQRALIYKDGDCYACGMASSQNADHQTWFTTPCPGASNRGPRIDKLVDEKYVRIKGRYCYGPSCVPGGRD